MIKGIPASSGVAIGKARIWVKAGWEIEKRTISNVAQEKKRFTRAVATAGEQLEAVKVKVAKEIGQDQAAIFEAQMMMLNDPELLQAVETMIQEQKVNAEYALRVAMDQYINLLEQVEDEYLRARTADLKDVANRVTGILMDAVDDKGLDQQAIIVARDLMPSETAQLKRDHVLGIVTAIGGTTSHTAIMARTLGIPAVVGADEALESIRNGDLLIVDGDAGLVFINPDQASQERYLAVQEKNLQAGQELLKLRDMEAITRDGHLVELAANIGSVADAGLALENGAMGIGLFRTEFLYMDKTNWPTEEEQYDAYREALVKMGGKPVIIRTLDVGGDKKLPYADFPEELNPFLGYRALRLCLDCPDIFKTQLRALYRASVSGKLRVMLPMVASVEELREVKRIAGEVRDQLKNEKISFREDVELGVMIEIPSAAIISAELAQEADFFSIGSNDLIQYTLAVDRTNQRISPLYNPFHPAVMRLIKMVADNAHFAGKPVGLCGEMAADLRLTPLLIGLGLDELSMNPGSLLKVKQRIRNLDSQKCKIMAEQALHLATAAEVQDLITKSSVE